MQGCHHIRVECSSWKSIHPNHTATGPWNPSNAASFIRYTVKKGYQIYGWELGNELCGKGIGVGVAADAYASDTIVLSNLIRDRDERLIGRILNPSALDGGAGVFKALQGSLRRSGTSAAAWVGESGGAYNRAVIESQMPSYLDQLGLASIYNTKTYCRQSLIGGNYGLLNTTTFVPNPDYYSALLWHKLMGRSVLSTNFTGTKDGPGLFPLVQSIYCFSKKHLTMACMLQKGVTLLLINLDDNTTVHAKIDFTGGAMNLHANRHYLRSSKVSGTTREDTTTQRTGTYKPDRSAERESFNGWFIGHYSGP
ncbi:Heparanase-like protein 3 [Sesamum alatum]|uniref:Heparanase-like protein 3 n=1 Tax=Sesamum alatum TaxID=300844 RepID=A0AAE2CFG7_9LAMI|nr:Heparanase-like protein 3 [Sesamum alatum]